MNSALEKETLHAMGYKEKSPKCEECKYFKEIENAYIDRMWDSICNFSNLGPMKIGRDGSCNKFEDRNHA